IPDLIVCDIMMPEIDGYEVLDQLSKSITTRNIPFIFLSAKTEKKDVRKGMNMGADDYLTKPFLEDELVSAIRSRLAKAEILKENHASSSSRSAQPDSELHSLNELKNYFDDNGTILIIKKEDVIYNENDHTNNVYLIRNGAVKCHRLDNHGKELVTGLYKEDDFFGYTSFNQNRPYAETAIAIMDTELVMLSLNQLKKLIAGNPDISIELLELLTIDLSNMKDQLIKMAYSSVAKKTASTILQFAEKINRCPDDPIKISRNDLASVAGIATETLIRTLTTFKKDGLIKSEGRNIQVLDIEGLKAIN
ncbi:MAG: response regulator, partial [Bacteroidia bacterium]|nr:response regulator [Bacteroidia bacterium]